MPPCTVTRNWFTSQKLTWTYTDPVHLVLDSEVTYYTDPLTRYKTTVRAVYDKARDRVGKFMDRL